MKSVVRFMNTWAGRALRIVLGLALIYWGWFLNGGSALGIIVAVIGLVPIIMGVWGRCLLELVSGGWRTARA